METKKRERIENLKPWKPGQSGNPSGRPKKKPITEIYERILADEGKKAAIQAAVEGLLTGSRMATILTLREVAERIEGKVKDEVDVNVSGLEAIVRLLDERRERLRAAESEDQEEATENLTE